jgi:hypothetical protein
MSLMLLLCSDPVAASSLATPFLPAAAGVCMHAIGTYLMFH